MRRNFSNSLPQTLNPKLVARQLTIPGKKPRGPNFHGLNDRVQKTRASNGEKRRAADTRPPSSPPNDRIWLRDLGPELILETEDSSIVASSSPPSQRNRSCHERKVKRNSGSSPRSLSPPPPPPIHGYYFFTGPASNSTFSDLNVCLWNPSM